MKRSVVIVLSLLSLILTYARAGQCVNRLMHWTVAVVAVARAHLREPSQ